MSMIERLSIAGLALVGCYYILTLISDGAKLQRFKKKYYGRMVA